MSFPRDAYPYTNFHELNLGYFIVHFREIFSQWADLYDQMLDWKDATTDELAAWKTGVEADLDQREAALRAELETWKAQTGQDIAGWEDATLAALTAWQTATQAVFEAIRVEAAGSASAAAASAGDAATAKTAAETAQAAAEAAAASVQASAAQIATNTGDIADLKTQLNGVTEGKNLIIYNVIPNEYPTATGFPSYNDWDRSDYIPVTPGDTICITNPVHLTNDNFWYNNEKTPITKFTIPIANPAEITVPEGAAYVVISNERANFFGDVYTRVDAYAAPSDVDELNAQLNNLEVKVDTKASAGQLNSLAEEVATKASIEQLNNLEEEVDTKASTGQLESEESSRLNADNILESNKIPFPVAPLSKYGEAGQILRSDGNGHTQWVDIGTPTPEQVETVVNDWMDEHSGSYVIPDGSITEQKFTDSLKEKAIKDYVTPQMYGYSESTDDVGYYINQALLENDSVFIPDGIYKIYTTIYLTGENTITYDDKYHQTKGKTIVFAPHALFDVQENIKVFDISGNANTIIGGLIDLTTVGADYNNAAIYLHSDDSNRQCFATKIKDTFISNVNPLNNNIATGIGIELHVENTGYIYSSEIDGVKLQNLEFGIKFTGSSTNGMNANMFTNISYWGCIQCAIITGGGNTFTGIGQCGKYRNSSDESACFYVDGTNNIIDVFVYDVGGNRLIKYIYELSQTAYNNILRYNGVQNYIGNQKLNKFWGYEKNENPVVLAGTSTSSIYDYSRTGQNMFKISNFDGCFDVNNFLNTEYVSNIECVVGGSAGNYGIPLNDVSKLRGLAKTISNGVIKLVPSVTGTYSLQIKYTFDFNGISTDKGTLEYFALKSSALYSACAKNISTITVKQILDNDTEIDMTELTSFSSANQISVYRVFKAPNIYFSRRVKNLIIDIAVNVPATPITNPYVLCISKLYATFGGDNKFGDSYSGLANRSGDTIFGDYLFNTGCGVILTAPNGNKYKISVDNNGTINSSLVT